MPLGDNFCKSCNFDVICCTVYISSSNADFVDIELHWWQGYCVLRACDVDEKDKHKITNMNFAFNIFNSRTRTWDLLVCFNLLSVFVFVFSFEISFLSIFWNYIFYFIVFIIKGNCSALAACFILIGRRLFV